MNKLNQMIDLALAHHEEHKTLEGYAFTVNPKFWDGLRFEERCPPPEENQIYMVMGMPVNIGDLTIPDVILERIPAPDKE
jgi:hypothetical protein